MTTGVLLTPDRSAPNIINDCIEKARAAAADSSAMYDMVPSYQRIMAREGVSKAAELAVIGTRAAVSRQLRSYLDAGATELVLIPLLTGADDVRRVWEAAATL